MDVETVLDRFERAWHQGEPPDIREFLASSAGQSAERADRQGLLCELVMVDLWYRWRRAKGGRRVPLASRQCRETMGKMPVPPPPGRVEFSSAPFP
ncbi:MAG: hypothetical protein ABIP48_05870, partial [Planctomycetota bacterium]